MVGVKIVASDPADANPAVPTYRSTMPQSRLVLVCLWAAVLATAIGVENVQIDDAPFGTFAPGSTAHAQTDTYMPKTEPVNTYMPQTEPVNTYMPKTEPVNTYMPQTEPVTTHMPKNEPVNTYMPKLEPVNSHLPATAPTDKAKHETGHEAVQKELKQIMSRPCARFLQNGNAPLCNK